MITILSYTPGCSGDFIATQIHKNDSYYNIILEPNGVNRYELPCLTRDIFGWEVKTSKRNITKKRMDVLNKVYNYKDLILPTHRFKSIYNDELDFIRLYSNNLDVIKLSYAMWIYKSHAICSVPWPDRWEQIQNTPEPYRTELITKFHKWKYLCYRYNLTVEGKFDIDAYIKGYFEIYKQQVDLSFKKVKGYKYFDISEIIYEANTSELEEYLNIELDKTRFKNYADANFKLLEDKSVDLYSENFFKQLTLSVKDSMMETMDLTNHDPDEPKDDD